MSEAAPVSAGQSAQGGRAALHQIRQSAQALIAEGKTDETWELLFAALEAVLSRNSNLELLVLKLRRAHTRSGSEQIDLKQLSLLFDELARQSDPDWEPDLEAEAQADAELDREIEEAERQAPRGKRKQRKRTAGWKTRGVQQEVHRVEVPPEERRCVDCGRDKRLLGVDVTRRLEFIPARFVEHEYHAEKYACGHCKNGVICAPAPAQVLERSAASSSLLAHVVTSKFVDHTPLHRLHRMYERLGADIPVSTLSDWTAAVGDLIEPLVDRLFTRVQQAFILRTDATGLRVLDPTSPGNIQRGTIWCLVGDDRDVVFRYTPTGEGESGPWKFLAGREGYIQADAASVFDRLFNGEAASAIELGCWSHARRKLHALQDTDCRVAWPLKLIARLYRIEHLADAQGLDAEARARMRQHRSQAVLKQLQSWYVIMARNEPPSSELAKAAAYAINHWEALIRFVKDGRISPDNNVCELQFRDIALGRRNYLFAGSHDAARRAANLYSLTRTCAQHGIPPLVYLTDILDKIAAGWTIDRLDELLPHRWQAPPG